MFLRKLIIAIIYNLVVFGWTFFSIAGTWNWWRAWIFLAVIEAATVVMMVAVLRHKPDLLRERFKGIIQRGQPWIDRLVIVPFIIGYGALLVITPLDVFKYHFLPKPGLVVSSLGMVLILVGYWIVALAFKENAFAIPIVKYQKERAHIVIDTGLYATVRHPMYVGLILLFLGMPLWLESYAGALVALTLAAILALRILVEERFLRRELPGYEAYTERVRYRLVPYMW